MGLRIGRSNKYDALEVSETEAVFGEAKGVKGFTVPAPPKMEFKRSKMRRVNRKRVASDGFLLWGGMWGSEV